jgi:hydrogenase nickel incorporation protein HypB
MCATCGCGDTSSVRVTVLTGDSTEVAEHRHSDGPSGEVGHWHVGHTHPHGEEGHTHPHSGDEHDADHHHDAPKARRAEISLETAVLAKNDRLAERNRGWLAARNVSAVNLMSSPGSGKTTLLERTIATAAGVPPIAVIEGDQETTFDAERIRATGSAVIQVNTGAGCHLDADMVARGLARLDPAQGTVVIIENVGNLVCPALFDLGESRRVVVMSVTEGSDKPLKYPHMFRTADLILLNKIDLQPYVDFDTEAFAGAVTALRPAARVLPCSAKTGEGLGEWMSWLRDEVPTAAALG